MNIKSGRSAKIKLGNSVKKKYRTTVNVKQVGGNLNKSGEGYEHKTWLDYEQNPGE